MAVHSSNSTHPFLVSGGFQRRLCRSGVLIECRCMRCGFRFIGSASHSLAKVESIHRHECLKRKSPQRAALQIVEDPHNGKAMKAHA